MHDNTYLLYSTVPVLKLSWGLPEKAKKCGGEADDGSIAPLCLFSLKK
jgi:hypothetical protein